MSKVVGRTRACCDGLLCIYLLQLPGQVQRLNDPKCSSLVVLPSGRQNAQFARYTRKEVGLLQECDAGGM